MVSLCSVLKQVATPQVVSITLLLLEGCVRVSCLAGPTICLDAV